MSKVVRKNNDTEERMVIIEAMTGRLLMGWVEVEEESGDPEWLFERDGTTQEWIFLMEAIELKNFLIPQGMELGYEMRALGLEPQQKGGANLQTSVSSWYWVEEDSVMLKQYKEVLEILASPRQRDPTPMITVPEVSGRIH